jgi:murein L,D-transpeptidase YafK
MKELFMMRPSRQIMCVLAPAGLIASTGANAAIRAELHTADHRLSFFDGDRLLKAYRVSLGSSGVGKCKAGDKRTPLGTYLLSPARQSQFRWFMPIDYPNAADRGKGCTGGDIGLHGTGEKFYRKIAQSSHMDWTLGCVAVTNHDIDDIKTMVTTKITLVITT